MYTVIVTAALVLAILFYDLLKENPDNDRTKFHVFFGIAAIVAMAVFVYLDMEYVGWGLLIIPIVVVLINYLILDTGSYNEFTQSTYKILELDS